MDGKSLPPITICPRVTCGRESHHPGDRDNGWCSACNQFYDDMAATERIERYIGPDADVGTPDVASLVLRKHLESRLILFGRHRYEMPRHQAALFLLAGYNQGFLLEHLLIRRHIRIDTHGAAVYFGKIAADLVEMPQPMVPIGNTSRSVLEMCCALSLDEFAFPAIGPWLAKLDGWNAWVTSLAFGIATDQVRLERPSTLREIRGELIRQEPPFRARLR